METVTINKDDLKAIVKDALGPMVAERMAEAEENLKTKFGADVDKRMDKLVAIDRAREDANATPRYDPKTGIDPYKGKGLNVARMAVAFLMAKMNGTGIHGAVEVAKKFNAERKDGSFEAVEKALLEGRFEDGALLIPPEFASEFIPLQRAAEVTTRAGVRTYGMKSPTVTFGKQNTSATAAYIGESQNITPSQPSFKDLKLSLKKMGALVPISNDLIRDGGPMVEALVRDDLVRVAALKKDLTVLRGTGTEHTPRGVENWIKAANKFNITGTALADKVNDLIKLIRLIDEGDVGLDGAAFIMSPRTKWALFAQLDSNGNFVFAPMLATGQLFGFPVLTTSQVPTNLGGGSNESKVYFGKWSEVIVGEKEGMAVELFPNGTYHDGSALVSGISADQSVIRLLDRHDVIDRYDNAQDVLEAVTY